MLEGIGLPTELTALIRDDASAISEILLQLLPSTARLQLRLEAFGKYGCTKWHQDNYVARAFVTYNGPGTDYADDSNVDFWELQNCGNAEHVLKDPSKIKSVAAGDILLIKGLTFPRGPAGLVHKSPQVRHYPDGRIMHRLCLKVDVLM
eukprot:gb/GFBE01051616.1/.p1 GENE.gb/GFBE01051616.1/~~gb/GFBE01051616.1/.p1  ORF type:complete len:149 (+),score=32.74 gb/GFBE01051616.1/:1-447(+)